jgi:hypothetical protein
MDVQVLIILLEVQQFFMFMFFLQIIRYQLGVSSSNCYEMKATIYRNY